MILDPRALLPGDIGFSTIGGRTGALVNLGQALLHDSCRYSHAFLVLDGGQAIEAMPHGARLVSTADRLGLGYAYRRVPMPMDRRVEVARLGRELEGTPYSFLDYYALGAAQWHLPGRKWARQRVTDSGHLICSQLVDLALSRAGFHLFNDGRLPQDVTPGDLFYQIDAVGGWAL